MRIEEDATCGYRCECGEILVFYGQDYPPDLPWRCRTVPFPFKRGSCVAQLNAMYEALVDAGVEVLLDDMHLRILAVNDGWARRPAVRVGVRFPTRGLGDAQWSFLIGDLEGRRESCRKSLHAGCACDDKAVLEEELERTDVGDRATEPTVDEQEWSHPADR